MRHLLVLLATLATVSTSAAEEIVTTAVGTGTPGYSGDGGPATGATLNNPFDVAFDAPGNLYLSDTLNHCVRRVDGRTGVITTVAGVGKKGFAGDGGPARSARLNEPYGVALDPAGNLFVADRLNRRVRRVDGRSGAITTVAGDGSNAFSGDGGPAGSAGLVEPNGLAVDGEGRRLYIADVADNRVRAVDLDTGTITTFAGNGRAGHDGDGGPARRASVFGARAVAVGPDGTVVIVERQGNAVRAVDPKTGTITTVAGTGKKGYSGDGGPARDATFNGPKELAVDRNGDLYVVDTENQAIRKVDARTRLITTLAGDGLRGGGGDNGPASRARLARPHGVAIGPDGSVYVGDTENQRIRKVSR